MADDPQVTFDDFDQAAKVDSLRRSNQRLKSELKVTQDHVQRLVGRLAVLEGIDRLDPKPPRWLTPKRSRSTAATVVAILSDCHFDEQVRPEDVAGVNAYDRIVATHRLRSWCDQLARLPQDGPSADVDGLVLMIAGDLTAGLIDTLHLVDSDDTVLGSMLYWSEQIAAAVTLLADSYGKVHVPVVIGNHGRLSARKRQHLAAADNTDFYVGKLVRRFLADDKRVTWQIDEATDAEFMVYQHRHVVTHGDQFNGGSGIGGIIPPVSRGYHRKAARQAQIGRPIDHLWMGHFHQVVFGPGWTINGSLKGADAYSMANNWPIEAPQQVAAYVTPGGIEWRTTIVAQ